MTADIIDVVLIGNPYPDSLGAISNRMREEFDTSVRIIETSFDPVVAFDRDRQQYDAGILLDELLRIAPGEDGRILGITGVDLFIPPLGFVFGDAHLNGRAAIVSSFRHRNSHYGLPRDRKLTLERLRKVCVHMMGHAFGLKHCVDYRCAMHTITSVEEIDVTTESLCAACRLELSGRTRR